MSTYSITNSFYRIRDEYRCLEIICAQSAQDAANNKFISSDNIKNNSILIDKSYSNLTDGEKYAKSNNNWYYLIENSSVVTQRTVSSLNCPYF